MNGSVVPTVPASEKAKGFRKSAIPGLPLAHQLEIPEFDWYLKPMYRRYEEILIERARDKRVVTVEKRRAPEVKAPPWEKHVKPSYPKWPFNKTPTARGICAQKQTHRIVSQKRGGALVFNE
eukprot:gnl/MRDRNA2_/MRDRNA2_143256_c0_seq1.p1 gnl/MRDRNA2_/MRDRNA2_143256_c0~~gnl/MRDRNA2_/MRDRNA2_143256_c0_seq1.p1  ORF type:complete len:122 (-),score=23.37 gnl/MRDRNA2_/MRDRNA2_143256_c0_seq1:85-450(-)